MSSATLSKSSFRWQTKLTLLNGSHQVHMWSFLNWQWKGLMTLFKARGLWLVLSAVASVTTKILASRNGTSKVPVLSLAWSLSVVPCLVLLFHLSPRLLRLLNAAVSSSLSWKGLAATDFCCWKVVINWKLTGYQPVINHWDICVCSF